MGQVLHASCFFTCILQMVPNQKPVLGDPDRVGLRIEPNLPDCHGAIALFS